MDITTFGKVTNVKKHRNMIDIDRVDLNSVQWTDTCVLFNYALIGNYYTGIEIIKYFEDYFKYFESTKPEFRNVNNVSFFYLNLLTTNPDIFVSHFHYLAKIGGLLNNYQAISGFMFIKQLHDTLPDSYATNRSLFTCDLIDVDENTNQILSSSISYQDLNLDLYSKDSLINIFVSNLMHSLTVYNFANNFYIHDTAHVLPQRQTNCANWHQANLKIRNILKYDRI